MSIESFQETKNEEHRTALLVSDKDQAHIEALRAARHGRKIAAQAINMTATDIREQFARLGRDDRKGAVDGSYSVTLDDNILLHTGSAELAANAELKDEDIKVRVKGTSPLSTAHDRPTQIIIQEIDGQKVLR